MSRDPGFFPFPTSMAKLWVATGKRDIMGCPETELDRAVWDQLAMERNEYRLTTQFWVRAAIADGWSHKPTYSHEAEDRACTLELDGFKCQVLTRPNKDPDENGRYGVLGNGEISCWGPDRMSIRVPLDYPGKQYFRDALVTCPHCKRGPNANYFENGKLLPVIDKVQHVPTKSYAFAGRACEQCVGPLKAATEQPGWCD